MGSTLVTHDPEVAASTERVVSMRDGSVVSDQTSEEYVRSLSAPFGGHR
ncbi:MAG: hypothetical protein O2860_12800 [Chloroflexi bacterium]|nr:hypothetical protein [Chloroflexota bacterium]